MLDLNVKDLRKKVKIRFSAKPDGHVFTVHRLGGGADLRISELMREAGRLAEKLKEAKTEDDLNELYKQIDKLHEERFAIKASVFDDGEDGSLAVALAKELSEPEIERILQAVETGTDIVTDEGQAHGEADKA